MALPYKKFQGEIEGKNIYSFTTGLDYSLKQQERINAVKERFYTQGDGQFLDKYFEKVFEQNGEKSNVKLVLNKEDHLSEDVNVCKMLDRVADYILYSPDGERMTKKTEYRFYTEDGLNDRINKEEKLEDMAKSVAEEDNDSMGEIIDFLIRQNVNYKKEKKQKILGSDLKDPQLKQVKDLDILIKKFQERNKIVKDFKRCKIIGDMRFDQILIKNMVKKPIFFKAPLPDSTEIDYDQFDFFIPEHVDALLRCKNTDFQTDLGCLVYDLNVLISMIELDELDNEILNLYRNGANATDISIELELNISLVNSAIKRIIRKIIKKYEDIYTDWYYLNIVKGRYKICSKCGEIKLIKEFGSDKRNKDGLQSFCKTCDSYRKNV